MTYEPGSALKRQSRVLRVYRACGVALILFVVSTSAIKPEIVSALVHGLGQMDYRHLFLYGATLLLTALWVQSTYYELDHVLCKWLDPEAYHPPDGVEIAAIIVVMGLFLGVLFFYVKQVYVYCLLFMAYSAVNALIGGLVMLSQIALAVQASEEKLSEDEQDEKDGVSQKTQACKIALAAIRLYWAQNLFAATNNKGTWQMKSWSAFFRNRYFVRLLIVLAGSIAAFVFATLFHRSHKSYLETIAYWTISGLILSSESWIVIWRIQRDRCLREASRKWDPTLQTKMNRDDDNSD